MTHKSIDGEKFLIQPASECTSAEDVREFAIKCHKQKVRGLIDDTAKIEKQRIKQSLFLDN